MSHSGGGTAAAAALLITRELLLLPRKPFQGPFPQNVIFCLWSLFLQISKLVSKLNGMLLPFHSPFYFQLLSFDGLCFGAEKDLIQSPVIRKCCFKGGNACCIHANKRGAVTIARHWCQRYFSSCYSSYFLFSPRHAPPPCPLHSTIPLMITGSGSL